MEEEATLLSSGEAAVAEFAAAAAAPEEDAVDDALAEEPSPFGFEVASEVVAVEDAAAELLVELFVERQGSFGGECRLL